MPRINIRTSKYLSKQKKLDIAEELMKIIDAIPYESGEFLITNFGDESSMIFGKNMEEPCLVAEIYILDKVYQRVDRSILEKALYLVTESICRHGGISMSKAYAYYCPVPMWAYEGKDIEKGLLNLD